MFYAVSSLRPPASVKMCTIAAHFLYLFILFSLLTLLSIDLMLLTYNYHACESGALCTV